MHERRIRFSAIGEDGQPADIALDLLHNLQRHACRRYLLTLLGALLSLVAAGWWVQAQEWLDRTLELPFEVTA